jgi:hypothetical protein
MSISILGILGNAFFFQKVANSNYTHGYNSALLR